MCEVNPSRIDCYGETNSQISPRASMCLCFEGKGDVFFAGLLKWDVLIYSPTLVIFEPGSIMSSIQHLTPGFVMNLFVTVTFYCLFQLTQHDCITAV